MKTYEISLEVRSDAEDAEALREEIDNIIRRAKEKSIAVVYNIMVSDITPKQNNQ